MREESSGLTGIRVAVECNERSKDFTLVIHQVGVEQSSGHGLLYRWEVELAAEGTRTRGNFISTPVTNLTAPIKLALDTTLG